MTERRQQALLGLRAQQRGAILAAAGPLFARRGAAGATMADVARHAGVAVGTLYRFFPSKQALHLALLEERAASILAHDAASESAPEPAGGLERSAGAEALLAADAWRTWLDKDPQRRARSQAARRAEILSAASASFQSRGFAGTAMADIAAAAGVSTGTLYNFFRSKESLFYCLIEEMAGAFFTHVRAEVDPIADPAARIARLVQAECAFFEDNRAFLRIYISARSGLDWTARQELGEAFQQKYAAFLAWVTDILAAGMEAGVLRRMDPAEMAAALLGMLNASLLEWTVGGSGPLAARAARITQLFLDGARSGAVAQAVQGVTKVE